MTTSSDWRVLVLLNNSIILTSAPMWDGVQAKALYNELRNQLTEERGYEIRLLYKGKPL
jgi:hypothetical protein